MWKVFLALLMLIVCSANAENVNTHICNKPRTEVCPGFDVKTPETEADLEKLCRASIEYFDCVLTHVEMCDRDPHVLNVVNSFLSTLKEVCDEETLLHAAVAESMKCYSELVEETDQTECHFENDSQTMQSLSHYTNALREKGLLAITDDEKEINSTRRCIHAYMEIACYALKVEEKCGIVAMCTYIEILTRLEPAVTGGCEQTTDLLPAVIRLYKLDKLEEEKKFISDIFKKRK